MKVQSYFLLLLGCLAKKNNCHKALGMKDEIDKFISENMNFLFLQCPLSSKVTTTLTQYVSGRLYMYRNHAQKN